MTKSIDNMYVVCYKESGRTSADLDNVYFSESEAKEVAEKLSNETFLCMSLGHYVLSLSDFLCHIRAEDHATYTSNSQ